MSHPVPNASLGRLHREAGWTLRQFAQAVNRLGTERGTPLRYREPSVHQWLAGGLPMPPVRPLVLEALARRLGRPVAAVEAGFPPIPGEADSQPNTVEGLIDLGRQDMDPSRRGVLGVGLFSVALAVPDWPDVAGRMEAARSGEARRIGMTDVDTVMAMTERLSELDDDFGGRHARPMAAAFLVNTVGPYLRADAAEAVRAKMMAAASFLCYVTGWMAMDEGRNGLAQHYYVKGLELAGAAGDHSTYCHILRGMSVHAADLGHGGAAVRFADAAAAAAPAAGPRMRAFLTGQQAHAHAMNGEKEQALRLLRETEVAMDKATSQAPTFGGYSPATVALHTAEVQHELGDTPGSIRSLQTHFHLRDSSDRRRSGLRFNAKLAERQLTVGHLEAACSSWGRVLDDYPRVHSGRVDAHIREMYRLIQPHLRNSHARSLYERARTVTPAVRNA
ncbi:MULTISPECIES: tetratricopeptide repeat protein [unclassified Streptomyces]|uniref:tetratricopeptide repeat protein n=1 Tax=unclassified Streptomyces TaxID=2593676 RepID=UPI001905B17D|nr:MULTISPECIES: tetratricopeptide repeat protein [unclassified Streptomyces]MCU4745619.1 tetratricopeptide repeat protein [Streptomyces sp. G-5]QQN79390.1 tetratricopeptide repeat protein [Streptomyces sp. XC 2026]